MLDIKFIRENPDLVKENIRKKFQNAKLPLVDEVIALDSERREAINEGEALKAERNKISKANGPLFGRLKKCADEAEKAALQAEIDANNAAVKANAERMTRLEEKKANAEAAMNKLLLVIPQMIDESVPIGPDDSCNVEVERFGEPMTPDFPIPYHTEIMERFDGVDMDAAARVSGNGFYYLMGDIARLHSAVTAYGRDFMIDKGFTYCIPPFMIHGNVVEGVMSQTDMDAMMYKIEGEDLYLIGTSEHTMIGRFIDQTLDESKMPLTLTSYSPCFRKEKGAHGIEERGIYRIHQFEKQEMIVVCRPEESADWYEKLWQMSVELFRSMEIPVRQLNCCSGDLADLKVKSCDIEAWSPRPACLHFGEQGSCFYGGPMVDEVYPAVRKCDALVMLCANYNDALAANLTACVNRLTALFRQTRFYDKRLFGLVVSGYSGGDLLARQLISALNMNKSFFLPPHFCLLETANERGSLLHLPGIRDTAAAFAREMAE